MTNLANVRSAASYFIRQRQRGRYYASQLAVHTAGQTIVGADAFGGRLTSGAMFVQSEVDGQPFVALTSGTTGATPLTGDMTINDGGVLWLKWSGKILSAPPTP